MFDCVLTFRGRNEIKSSNNGWKPKYTTLGIKTFFKSAFTFSWYVMNIKRTFVIYLSFSNCISLSDLFLKDWTCICWFHFRRKFSCFNRLSKFSIKTEAKISILYLIILVSISGSWAVFKELTFHHNYFSIPQTKNSSKEKNYYLENYLSLVLFSWITKFSMDINIGFSKWLVLTNRFSYCGLSKFLKNLQKIFRFF